MSEEQKPFELKEGLLNLFKTHPSRAKFSDYTGVLLLNGQEYWVNIKSKPSTKGEDFYSGSVKPKEPSQPRTYEIKKDPTEYRNTSYSDDERRASTAPTREDDIPF